MKNTGVVRKIDELGRIVIPKEIRKTLNIKNGEDVQIYIENDSIILRKFMKMLSVKDNAEMFMKTLLKFTNSSIYISDKDKIILGSEEAFIGEQLSKKILDSIEERKIIEDYKIDIGGKELDKYYLSVPIIVDADSIGTILLTNEYKILETDKMLAKILGTLITNNMY